ncbi:MAG: TetR/AcrR family transcriptional regulator [Caulobacterales bacterium]|nr:TetR/AcrR family transcriptional regulator [Caulobacterales bacterium]
MTESKLSKIDWIKAGFRALCNGGVGAIRIEPIARQIGTTKGSFYWHFKDLAALKIAMLEFYTQKGTQDIIDTANMRTTPNEALMFVVKSALNPPEDDVGSVMAEAAIREWARFDDYARQNINKIDEMRTNFLHQNIIELGYENAEAKARAQILYSAYIGFIQLRATSSKIKNGLLIAFAKSIINEAPKISL